MTESIDIRTGIGIDICEFSGEEDLVLGGIEIPGEKRLRGNFDGDVVLRAITDALLGALALGDISNNFPDSDTRFKNMSSSALLKDTYNQVMTEGFELNNMDCTIVLENPKISPHISAMRRKITDICWCYKEQVSIKMTPASASIFTGSKQGAASMAVVSLRRKKR
jgi:2-C-methyl-D-erythritol 2,4-cyclodiphosphate synthase